MRTKIKLKKYNYFKDIAAVIIISAILYLISLGILKDITYITSDITYITNDLLYTIKNFEVTKKNIEIPTCQECNIILISLDTLRADRLGIYGYGLNTSPNIDKFAEENIVFKEAFANGYFTIPSHMSIFTSLYPITHKINNPASKETEQLNKLGKEHKTIAEILKENNYKTSWLGTLTSSYLDLNRGFERGFDYFYEKIFSKQNGFNKNIFSEVIRNNNNEKFFWFVHSSINHAPYTYPEQFNYKFSNSGYIGKLPKNFSIIDEIWFDKIKKEFRENPKTLFDKLGLLPEQEKVFIDAINSNDLEKFRALIGDIGENRLFVATGLWANFVYYETVWNNMSEEDIIQLSGSYNNGVYYMDYLLEEFFTELKKQDLWDNTIIIITSDHGEELYEHKGFDHGNFYDHTVHIPLIIRVPGVKTKIEIEQLAQSIDILPTILDLLKIEIPQQMQGKSLINIRNNDNKKNQYVYGYSLGDYYIRSEKWKYMLNNDGSEELYFLLNDSKEQNNLIEKNSIILKRIKNKLKHDLERWITSQNKK
ncbi:sulfatase [Candidatus Woesearchaeota archaeon]|nr:sulfatase [Candidatus Woesearchaeota archaeon]